MPLAAAIAVPQPILTPCVEPAMVIGPPVPNVPARLILPLPSRVEVADGVCRVVVPPPVTMAVLAKLPLPTTVTVPVPPPEAKQLPPEEFKHSTLPLLVLPKMRKCPLAGEDGAEPSEVKS